MHFARDLLGIFRQLVVWILARTAATGRIVALVVDVVVVVVLAAVRRHQRRALVRRTGVRAVAVRVQLSVRNSPENLLVKCFQIPPPIEYTKTVVIYRTRTSRSSLGVLVS